MQDIYCTTRFLGKQTCEYTHTHTHTNLGLSRNTRPGERVVRSAHSFVVAQHTQGEHKNDGQEVK